MQLTCLLFALETIAGRSAGLEQVSWMRPLVAEMSVQEAKVHGEAVPTAADGLKVGHDGGEPRSDDVGSGAE